MAPVRVVLSGLPPTHGAIPEHIRPKIAEQLKALHSQFTQAGYEYEFIGISPEVDMADVAKQFEAFRPDCVVLGHGVSGNGNLYPMMEKFIDVVRTSAPQAKLAFNTMPDNTIDAVRRWFSSAEK